MLKNIYRNNFFKIIGFCALGVLSLIAILVLMVSMVYPQLPNMDDLIHYQPSLPMQIYSSNNTLIGEFGQRRIFIKYANTPKMLINAIISAEDVRFYQHNGIDYKGIIRAMLGDIINAHYQSGASTITMQVARNFFLTSKKTIIRKFNEILLAYKIEHSLTKQQILELYINQLFLGQKAYGFAKASLVYFNKNLNGLSVAEYAMLAGLPKAPSSANPVVNIKKARERELYILSRMHTLHYINEKEYKQAINEKITIYDDNDDYYDNDYYGYATEMVREIMYSKFGNKIYTQGYKVYSTIDTTLQITANNALQHGLIDYDMKYIKYHGTESQFNLKNNKIDNILNKVHDYGIVKAAIVLAINANTITAQLKNHTNIIIKIQNTKYSKKLLFGKSNTKMKVGSLIRVININNKWIICQIPTVEGGIVAINSNTGAILAIIGGFNYYKNNFNHITQAMRQPGSSFKPFIYSAALESGFNANSIIDASKICFNVGVNQKEWCPQNNENESFGLITLRQALALSVNTVTVKILNAITPIFAINYITKFGFKSEQFESYLSFALGVDNVTPIQMAQAYAVFANGGYLIHPYIITKIMDKNNTVIATTNIDDIKQESTVIDPRNAFIMDNMLKDVIRYGTGIRAYKAINRDDIAGKTGTTSDNKDVWFDGYGPNITTITWVGYDQPMSLGKNAYGANVALPIWINFMKQALTNVPVTNKSVPQGITIENNSTWKNNDEYIYDSSFKKNESAPLDKYNTIDDLLKNILK